MDQPKVAGQAPCEFQLQAGKKYAWCACGHSANQPFCDGSHSGTAFRPVVMECGNDETVYFCMCKRTANRPYCDGSHAQLDSA